MGPVPEVELGEDPLDVRLDRRFLDDERGRDLGIREAARDELEDVAFPGRELAETVTSGGVGLDVARYEVYDRARDIGGE